MSDYDVAIIGAGPAGLALAAALGSHALRVAVISDDVDRPWPNNYGAWVDELDGLALLEGIEPFAKIWRKPFVHPGGAFDGRALGRAYAKLDGEALKTGLLEKTRAEFLNARVETVIDGTPHVLETGQGRVQARFVVDASGHGAHFSSRPATDPGYQTAWGVEVRCEGEPIDGHEMALMDFRPVDDEDDFETPTFLYAMKLGTDHWFLEETVLVGRPAVAIQKLKDRLERRLADRGVRVLETLESERCKFPMGHTLPEFGIVQNNRVAIGGAASQVHPATGYMVSRVLRSVEDVAESIQQRLAGQSVDPWAAVWPAERRSARRLYHFGMETLLSLDRDDTARFFDAFFELPYDDWTAYLSDELSGKEVARVMLRLFGQAGLNLKLKLASAAIGKETPALMEALLKLR